MKVLAAMIALSVASASAEDWPWIYGPRRDGTSVERGVFRTWPKDGPRVEWTSRVGPGFGGPAIKDGKVYLLDRDERKGDQLRVFDLSNGKELWKFAYDAPGAFMFPGSRTTPSVDREQVYTVGPLGDLYAIDVKTRKAVWHTNIWTDFGGEKPPRWGIVQNPLLYEDLVIVAPQTPQASVVAYDRLSGALKWKSPPLAGGAGYVSPAIVKVGGEDHLVMVTSGGRRAPPGRSSSVNGLNPRSGTVLWTYTNWRCGIPVPQPLDAGDGRVLVTAGYDAGTVMIRIEKQGDGGYAVTELFKNPDFGAHTQPPVLYQGHFYSQDTTNNHDDGLVAMSMEGQVKWKTERQPAFVRGGTILVDDLLLMTDGNTKLYLVEPNPAGFKPLASAEVLEPGDNWAPLALAGGRLLVRGQKQLKCLRVAQ